MSGKIPDKKTVEAARRLYLKYGGSQHERITRELRAAGHRFYRAMLYPVRYKRGTSPGWPRRFGWDDILRKQGREPQRRRTAGRNDFQRWLTEVSPDMTWSWKYLKVIFRSIDRLRRGGGRLMIFMPPRHGKSETVTIRYTAWRLLRDPKLNVIIASYNQKLANKFSRRIRQIVESGEPKAENGKRARAVAEWETTGGGVVRAVGVGAGIAGFGAGLIVIDDPVRNRVDAESKTYRDRVSDWFSDDIYTRLEPNASIILIQTRWHEDDLAGRLLKEMENEGEHWDVVSLPAIAEVGEKRSGEAEEATPLTDPLGRLQGEALCPERYDIKALMRIRRKLGSYSFSALYQQRPTPAEGGMFKREWFCKIVDNAPSGLVWKRGYDLAVSTRQMADYTASFRVAKDERGNYYIADGYRKKIEYPEQRRFAIERMIVEKDTEHGIESALHGTAFVQDLRREPAVAATPFRSIRVDGDKLTRALVWMNLAEEGRVFLVRGPWVDDFIEEVISFPYGRHDDQIDAVSLAFAMLTRKKKNAWGF